MAETNHIGVDEARITRVVTKAIKDAAADLELAAQRYLARGEKFDAKVFAELHRALADIAEQYAVDLTKSDWGKQIIAAAAKGAKAVPGASFDLSKDQIDIALKNAGWKIKDVLDEGAARVQDIVAGGMIRGDSLREISKAVEEGVQIEGGIIDTARADMIARNETFGAYRQTSAAAAEAEGIELFQMRGPVDSRTTPICLRHVGQVKTAAQWEKIRSGAMTWGLHYQCRHSFDPVRSEKAPVVERYKKLAQKQVEAAA